MVLNLGFAYAWQLVACSKFVGIEGGKGIKNGKEDL